MQETGQIYLTLAEGQQWLKWEGTPVLNKCIGFSSKKQNCSEIQNKELILKIWSYIDFLNSHTCLFPTAY